MKRWNADPPGTTEPWAADKALFVSADELLTVNTWEGIVTLWNISDAKAIYTLKCHHNLVLALSANRKQLALFDKGNLFILDAATGNTLAAVPAESEFETALAFRPDGRQLASLAMDRLRIWDLVKKELVDDVWLPKDTFQSGSAAAQWIDDDHVLAGGSSLIDIPRHIVLWEYRLPPRQRSSNCVVDGALAYVYSSGAVTGRHRSSPQTGVFFAVLPHEEAKRLAAGLSAENLLAVKPGIQVSLDIQVPAAKPEDAQRIVDSLTERLKKNGITVAPGAPITLKASVETGKTETKTYRRIGSLSGPSTETATVTEQIYRLAFLESGRVLWERRGGSAGPMMVHLAEGETVQSAIDKPRQSSPVGFFLQGSLPGRLARPGEKGAYGESNLKPTTASTDSRP